MKKLIFITVLLSAWTARGAEGGQGAPDIQLPARWDVKAARSDDIPGHADIVKARMHLTADGRHLGLAFFTREKPDPSKTTFQVTVEFEGETGARKFLIRNKDPEPLFQIVLVHEEFPGGRFRMVALFPRAYKVDSRTKGIAFLLPRQKGIEEITGDARVVFEVLEERRLLDSVTMGEDQPEGPEPKRESKSITVPLAGALLLVAACAITVYVIKKRRRPVSSS